MSEEIKFNCNHCNGPLVADAAGAGTAIVCPHCHQQTIIAFAQVSEEYSTQAPSSPPIPVALPAHETTPSSPPPKKNPFIHNYQTTSGWAVFYYILAVLAAVGGLFALADEGGDRALGFIYFISLTLTLCFVASMINIAANIRRILADSRALLWDIKRNTRPK